MSSWATDTNYSGLTGDQAVWNGTPTKVTPTAGERLQGVVPQDPIAAQKINYILGEAYMRKARVTYSPSGTVNDVNPTDFASCGVFMLTPSAATVITGLVPGTYTDRMLDIVHAGTAGANEFPVIFPDQHTGSTAANRVRGRMGALPLILLPGDSMRLLYNATASRWDCVYHSRGMTESGFCNAGWTDFQFVTTSIYADDGGQIVDPWPVSDTGLTATEKAQGVVALTTGGSTSFDAWVGVAESGAGAITPGQGQAFVVARLFISAVSDGTDTFRTTFGFHDAMMQTDDVADNGAFISYTHSENSGKWKACCAGSATRTDADTTVTPSTSVFHTMFVYCNADWSAATAAVSADGIDWTFTALSGANMPTATELTAMGVHMGKSAGTTSRSTYVDFLGCRFDGARG
jgi:hypothetical protein